MRRDIVFVHIPKTAGTSLRVVLEKTCRDHVILRDYGDALETTPELFKLGHQERRLSEFRQQFNHERRGILLSGHFPASRYWEFFNAESFATFIRNPIDRVLSEYNHFVNYHKWTKPVEEFVRLPRFRNVMTQFLAGVDVAAFGFIGIVEDFDRSMERFGHYVGAQLPSRKENIGSYRAEEAELWSRNNIRAVIAELNADDLELYERLRTDRAGARGGDQSLISGHYRGRVRATNDAGISGWVCSRDREFICDVEVLEKGFVLGCVKADRYREDIKKKSFSRSGVCGFRINQRALSAMGATRDGTLTVKVRGAEFEVPGSPVKLGASATRPPDG